MTAHGAVVTKNSLLTQFRRLSGIRPVTRHTHTSVFRLKELHKSDTLKGCDLSQGMSDQTMQSVNEFRLTNIRLGYTNAN